MSSRKGSAPYGIARSITTSSTDDVEDYLDVFTAVNS